MILPDDVLLVQFGHNDQKPDPVGTDPWTTYRSHLRLYLEAARERDAVPVLLTRRHDAGSTTPETPTRATASTRTRCVRWPPPNVCA